MTIRAGVLIAGGALAVVLMGCSSTGSSTLQLKDENTGPVAYHSDGTRLLLNAGVRFTPGDYLNFDDPDYEGNSTKIVAHNHSICHVTYASGTSYGGWCKSVFDFANGSITVAHETWNPTMSGNGTIDTGAITSGTGHYTGARGTVTFSTVSGANSSVVLALVITYTT